MSQVNKHLSQRIIHIQNILSSNKIDGLVFLNMNNIRYLSGFTGSEAILLAGFHGTSLFVDGRYTSQAERETRNIQIMECPDKIEALSGAIKKLRLDSVGFEDDSISLAAYHQLTGRCAKQKFIALSDQLRMLRACKDDDEITLMKKAAQISSATLRSVIHQIKPGWTEQEIALELEMKARKSGAEGLAFETIVAAGENSSLPHARPRDRKIKKGDFVVMDFGVRYKGYCSDETCTVAFGKLTDRQKNAYQIVKNAHARALDAIGSEVAAAEIDRCARSIFGKKFSRYFVHGTGHGVGLDIHEAPRLSAASADILKPRMVFTVEPGLYIPGLWGIRIEDTVLLKENSCEKLTKMDKELIIL